MWLLDILRFCAPACPSYVFHVDSRPVRRVRAAGVWFLVVGVAVVIESLLGHVPMRSEMTENHQQMGETAASRWPHDGCIDRDLETTVNVHDANALLLG